MREELLFEADKIDEFDEHPDIVRHHHRVEFILHRFRYLIAERGGFLPETIMVSGSCS